MAVGGTEILRGKVETLGQSKGRSMGDRGASKGERQQEQLESARKRERILCQIETAKKSGGRWGGRNGRSGGVGKKRGASMDGVLA